MKGGDKGKMNGGYMMKGVPGGMMATQGMSRPAMRKGIGKGGKMKGMDLPIRRLTLQRPEW